MHLVGAAVAQSGESTGASSNRLLHRFDFDEKDNLEALPKYWVPLRPADFPRFAHGSFDFEVGRQAPPSFHLASEGRNVAYHYAGPEARVRANTEYRVEGLVRSDRLKYARACLGAHFLDKRSRPLPGTLVRSRWVGGPDEPAGWTRIELHLSAAPPTAHTIGLHAWVLQEEKWRTVLPQRRHIIRTDVFGGAWFDDISIYTLPRVELTSSAAGNVLAPGRPQELRVVLADNDDTSLKGRLSISSVAGTVLAERSIPVVVGDEPMPVSVPVDNLLPGLYRARLDVLSGDELLITRTLTFARLAPLFREEGGLARPFGVVVEPRSRSDPSTELNLLINQAIRSVKLPVWTGLAESPPTAAKRRATDRLLQELAKNSFAITGVFFGPPAAIVLSDGAYPRPLIELLTDSPAAWQEHLAAVAAPYAGLFHWWQVGPDDGSVGPPPDKQALAVSQLRDAMRRFITVPLLGVPTSATVEPPAEKLPAEQLSIALGSDLHPDWLSVAIERFGELGYDRLSAFIEPLPPDQYRGRARLANWAQRIITARHAGAATVFVPQTWRVRDTAWGLLTEPTEEYLILRTIADVLAGAAPGQRLVLGPSVRCLAFHDGESTILAVWDPKAPPEGSRYMIQLGKAERQIDLWGRPTALQRAEDGRQIVQLTPMPVLIDGIERWLIDFRTSLGLQPRMVETGVELVTHTLTMANESRRAITGRVQIAVPESWDVSPPSFEVNLLPRGEGAHSVQIRYPHSAPAGVKEVLAKITLAGSGYYLEVPLSIELGLSDVDVSGLAVVQGKDLFLRHVVTNRSRDVLNFRGSTNVPGRERQYRPFSNLRPGDTQVVEYRISGGASLIGSKVRLGLLELNDGPRRHNLELTVP